MVKGQLRAVGNSLHLKNRYGSGYRLSVVTEPSNVRNFLLFMFVFVLFFFFFEIFVFFVQVGVVSDTIQKMVPGSELKVIKQTYTTNTNKYKHK